MKSFPSLTSVYVTRKHPKSTERKKATFSQPHSRDLVRVESDQSSCFSPPVPAAFKLSDSRRDPNSATSSARYVRTLTRSPEVLIPHAKALLLMVGLE